MRFSCIVTSDLRTTFELLVLWLTPGRGSCLFAVVVNSLYQVSPECNVANYVTRSDRVRPCALYLMSDVPHWWQSQLTESWLLGLAPHRQWPPVGPGWAGSVVSRLLGGAGRGVECRVVTVRLTPNRIIEENTHKLRLTSRIKLTNTIITGMFFLRHLIHQFKVSWLHQMASFRNWFS